MNNILNLTKLKSGINYTKLKCNLLTTSSIIHSKGKQTKEDIIIEENYNPTGFKIEDNGTYLTINFYRIPSHAFISVREFKEAIEEETKLINETFLYWSCSRYLSEVAQKQIRIYKDKRIALLIKLVNGRTLICKEFTPGQRSKETFIEVCTNEDAEREAIPLTKKILKENKSLLCGVYDPSDLERKRIFNYNSGYGGELSENTRKIVKKFFNNNKKNCKASDRSPNTVLEDGIRTLYDIYYWCTITPKQIEVKENKGETINRLIKEAGLQEYFDNPGQYINQKIWTRYGDEIICFIPEIHTYFEQSRTKFFSFNIKTKKRKYSEMYRGDGNNSNWSFPVPSLKYVTKQMKLGRDDSPGKKYEAKTVILNNLSIKELFKGSNVGWLLDNLNVEFKIFDEKVSSYEQQEKPLRSIFDFLNQGHIGQIALEILISTSNPLLEQLLKSRLFNLYYKGLRELEGNESCIFYDLDDKKNKFDHFETDFDFLYHSKQKNLKKMFGISLNNLRILDKKMAYKFKEESVNRWSHYESEINNYNCFRYLLDKDLLTMDSRTFEQYLNAYKEHRLISQYWSADLIISVLPYLPKSFMGKMNFFDKYQFASQYTIRDYYRMREQFKKLQQKHPEIDAFSLEEEYPAFPEKAQKFIVYRAEENGVRELGYFNYINNPLYDVDADNEDRFIYTLTDDYKLNKESIKYCYNSSGELEGALVTFNPSQHLTYLHNQIQKWINFYEDSTKEADFEEAVKRVKELEYEDPSTGLCIIAPTCTKDIREEGRVLQHCVSSYIDPIIGGTENVMFIRRMDRKNSPYYTVDILNNGTIRQVHCFRNKCVTKEDQEEAYEASGYAVYDKYFDIIKFLTNWAKVKKNKVRESSIHTAYGALCANKN